MKTSSIAAGVFKAKCLSILDEVAAGRRSVTITKRGKPVAQLVAMPPQAGHDLRGSVLDDDDALLLPVDVAWNAAR